jgi:hypothetical protein
MNTNNTTNVLPEFKTPKVFYPFIGMICILIVILFMVLFKIKIPFTKKISNSNEEIVADIFIILFFTLLIVGICITLLPNFKDVKTLFEQISNVTYAIIYTIFLILFFTIMPTNLLDKYAYIFIPITILLGAFVFYKGITYNYINHFNVNYERIKTMILLFCLITIFIIYYNIDPGGYIQKYFGYSLLLTIIITVFAFLYLIVVLTLPSENTNANFLNNFSGFASYGSIAFLLFLVTITITILTYPGGFFKDKTMSAFGMIMILIISILWATFLGATLFPEGLDANNKVNLFKKSLLILFGIIISGLIIFWIVYNVHNLTSSSGILTFTLNLLLVAIVLGLIYKTINVRLPFGNSNKNAFFNMLIHIIFYIPCLFNGFFDSIGKFMVGEYNSTTMGSLLMLITSILLIIGYYQIPFLFNKINIQGGKQLIDNPVYTDSLQSLGTYQELNGSDTFDYQYAISCWIYLDAVPPNTNSSYAKYTSLLNFGRKPNILYNGEKHSFMITMEQKDLINKTHNKLTDFDEQNNRIIYTNEDILLQKWNNVIINYNGGVLDIFLNGELVKSAVGVVPYYTIDSLTIGEDNGIKGGIQNVVYFKKALTTSNIYYLYNLKKYF